MTLLQLDARSLFRRIADRKEDYLMILNLKRTRSHFVDVFYSKYNDVSLDDLKYLEENEI